MQFEWSKSGLEILAHLQANINQFGGIEVYAELVEQEQVTGNKFINLRNRNIKICRIINNRSIFLRDALVLMNMTVSEYSNFRNVYKDLIYEKSY